MTHTENIKTNTPTSPKDILINIIIHLMNFETKKENISQLKA